MEIKTPQELIDFAFNTYLMFGTYSLQDKSCPSECFSDEFKVETLDDIYRLAQLFQDAINIGHKHLSEGDIAWFASDFPYKIEHVFRDDEVYEEYAKKIKAIAGEESELTEVLTNY